METESDMFASPPQPIFNHRDNPICREQVQLSLVQLADTNDRTMTAATTVSSPFKRIASCSEFLFLLCNRFGLTKERFLALEIFYRFMPKHIEELHEHVTSVRSEASTSPSNISWEQVENRLQHQILLRLMTCVQLASKMSSHGCIVDLVSARKFLAQCGLRYSLPSLVQSEIRVLQTLNYRLSIDSPENCAELILESVSRNRSYPMPSNQLYAVVLKLIELIYLIWDEIYGELFNLCNIQERTTESKRLEGNYVFVASAAITAASFFVGASHSDQLTSDLSVTTSIPIEDILDFSSVIIEQVLATTADE